MRFSGLGGSFTFNDKQGLGHVARSAKDFMEAVQDPPTESSWECGPASPRAKNRNSKYAI